MAMFSLLTAALAQAGTDAAAAIGATPGASAPPAAPNLFDYVRDGGIISYLLIALSVLALALIIRNLFMFRYSEFAPPRVTQPLEGFLAAGRIAEAQQLCQLAENRSFITTVLAEAFRRTASSSFGTLEFRSTVEEVAVAEADEVHRMNDGIGIIAAIGPMLGLLGTVFGMVGAFRTVGSLEGAARSNQLATSMSMALVNTAQGLIVAIPCTIAFALFRRKVDRIMQVVGRDLERYASYVTNGGAERPVSGGGSPTPTTSSRSSASAATTSQGARG